MFFLSTFVPFSCIFALDKLNVRLTVYNLYYQYSVLFIYRTFGRVTSVKYFLTSSFSREWSYFQVEWEILPSLSNTHFNLYKFKIPFNNLR
jgi:hypothetical protein